MAANALTERGGIVLTKTGGYFHSYLTIPGTDEWRELSWHPGREPVLMNDTIVITQEELTAHIRKNFVGWTVRKTNLPNVTLEHNAEVTAPT